MPKLDDWKEVGGDVKALAKHVQSHADVNSALGEIGKPNSTMELC